LAVAINLVLIIVGFVLLIKGADFLVNGASSLAKKFNISELAIGLTVVAMGTSAPELVVNIIAGLGGHNDAVFGNIIGSNIFNMFLILGVAGTIYPLYVQNDTVWKEIPFSLFATLAFYFMVNDQLFFDAELSILSQWDAIILLVLFLGFLLYVFLNMKETSETEIDDMEVTSNTKTTLMIMGGMAGLVYGGDLIVDNAISVAQIFQVSEKLIGLTILAAGTSLPELATSAVAAFQKKSDIAVGNIIGSNIFNVLLVLGVSALLQPLTYNIVLNTDLNIMVFGTLLLFAFMFTFKRNRLDRIESGLYLTGFFAYMIFVFIREQVAI